MVKKHVKGNVWWNFSFWAMKRSKKVKKYEDSRWLHKNVSKMTAHFNGKNGTETLLCDIIVVLNIDAFLHQWVLSGEGFGSKYKLYFTWEMAEEFARCSAGIICLFFIVFCPIAGLQRSIVKLKIVDTASFLTTNWRSLKEVPPNSLLQDFVQSYLRYSVLHKCENALMAWSIFFSFYTPFSLKFWVLGKLESANFWFWVVFLWSSLWSW